MFQIAFYVAQKLTDYMVKQRVEVVILFTFVVALGVAVSVMWLKIGDMQVEGKVERLEIKKECAKEIDGLRAELRDCQAQKDKLALKIAALEAAVKSKR